MAQLTFLIRFGELRLTALIGHSRNNLAALVAAGKMPLPMWTRAVVDTGTNVTCVTPGVLRRLGLTPTGQGSTHTAAGQATVNLFEVSLGIPPAGNAPGPGFAPRDLVVMELPIAIPRVEVLIGMDVLLDCTLLVEGPARQFTLEF
jgi:hypothetical protein